MGFHSQLVGKDLHSPSSEQVENHSGATIPVMRAVKYTGMGIVFPQINLANSSSDIIRGITQTDIEDGSVGMITSLGFLNGVDTHLWVVNTILYADNFGNITNAPTGLPVATVLKQDVLNGIVYVISTGIIKADLDNLTFPDPLSLELAWDSAHPSFYSEPTYDIGGKITRSDVWESAAKLLHIFSKVYTYTGANLTKVLVTREYDGKTLQKDVAYDINGRIINITRTYTP